ncbi:MAG: lipopolysaccharide biosynthesis protein, partial [bacterium]
LAQSYSVMGRLIALLIILFLLHFTESRLLYLGIVLSSAPVFTGIILSVILFRTRYRDISPSLHLIRKSAVRHVMSLGIKFFIIQVAAIVFYQTNNIIVAQMFGPEEVTPYSIAFRYFGLVTMGFTIIVSPYWSAITEAFTKNEYGWIRESINNLRKIWIVFLGITVLMLLGSDFIIQLWVGDQIKIPTALSVALAIYVLLRSYNNIFINFLNGTGKIKFQIYRVSIMTVFYIPLTIFFTKTFGIEGIMFAMIIFAAITLFFYEYQYHLIMSGKAKGIWNR